MVTFLAVGTKAGAAIGLVLLLADIGKVTFPLLSPLIIVELRMLRLDLFESLDTCLYLYQIGSQAKQFIVAHVPLATLKLSEQLTSSAHI